MSEKIRFVEEGHRYFIGETELIPLTRLLRESGIGADLSKIPAPILERKRLIGISVHKAIWMMVRGSLDWDSLGEDVIGYVKAARDYLEADPEPITSYEIPYGSIELGYGCTPDLVRKNSIVEWKTSSRIYPEVAIQLAGQVRAVGGVRSRIAIQLLPDGKFKRYTYEDVGDFDVLECALGIQKWKTKVTSTRVRRAKPQLS